MKKKRENPEEALNEPVEVNEPIEAQEPEESKAPEEAEEPEEANEAEKAEETEAPEGAEAEEPEPNSPNQPNSSHAIPAEEVKKMLEEAELRGEIRGRNARIAEFMRQVHDSDGVPHPGCGQASGSAPASIFDLARGAW